MLISVYGIKFYEHSVSGSLTGNMRTDRRTDGTTKLMDSFRDFANRLKKNTSYFKKLHISSLKINDCVINPTAGTGECGKAFDRFLWLIVIQETRLGAQKCVLTLRNDGVWTPNFLSPNFLVHPLSQMVERYRDRKPETTNMLIEFHFALFLRRV